MDPKPHAARPCWIATLVLVVLTGASFAISHVDLGPWEALALLGNATAMAAIIVVIFFGIARQPGSNRLVLTSAVALVLLLIGFMTADVLLR